MEIRLRDEIEAVAEQRRRLPLGGRLKEDYRFEQLRNDYLLDYAGFGATDPSLVSVMNVFKKTSEGINKTSSTTTSRNMCWAQPTIEL